MSDSDLMRGVSRSQAATVSRFYLGSRQGSTESPFLMPDEGGPGSGNGGQQALKEEPRSLARNYDLARQGQAQDEPELASAKLSSARELTALAPEQAKTAASKTPGTSLTLQRNGAEKPAGLSGEVRPTPTAKSPNAAISKSVASDQQQVANSNDKLGMVGAQQARNMKNALLKQRISLRQAAEPKAVGKAVKAGQDAQAQLLVEDEQKHQRKPQKQERKTDAEKLLSGINNQQGNAAKAFVQPTEAVSNTSAVELPEQLIQQMDPARQSEQGSVQLSLNMPDGSPLQVRLSWRAGRVTARFESRDRELINELEEGWGQLVRKAADQGLQLEPPQFTQQAPLSATHNRRFA